MSNALLSFKIGPVQPFIEAARTLRDLWSGSYLLSWLTAHGMKPIIERYGYDAFVTPHMTAENPLVRAVMSKTPTKDETATLACLPHTFAAAVNWDDRATLRKAVEDAVRHEWKRIADAVKAALPAVMHSHFANWDKQVETYFEITVVVRQDQGTPTDSEKWVEHEWEPLAELLEMTRSVRHVPAYAPKGDDKNRFPVKCSQLGSFEQMGPADFDAAKKYWATLTKRKADGSNAPGWDGRHGTRLQSSDKLCAVALVKRFMWPAYFAVTEPPLVGRLGVPVRKLRFTDTATMAARKWLEKGNEKIDPAVEWAEREHWSGQWLHWTERTNDDDEDCCEDVWNRIQDKKREQGRPPTYFALIHLDGDNMGDLFTGELGPAEWGYGRTRYRKITECVTHFAQEVRGVVKQHHGELIYAGGDDVLAFLPTDEAIRCAAAIHAKFCEVLEAAKWPEGKAPSLSGGIAVVHYKEDLRFALEQVRKAEKAAKRIGRTKNTTPKGKDDKLGDTKVKNALALTICRRSGEHSTVVMGWNETKLLADRVKTDDGKEKLVGLIPAFSDGASDRWAYKLREELPTLIGLPLAAGRAEAMRLVGRGEFGGKDRKEQFERVIEQLFDAYQKQMRQPSRNWCDADILAGFVALCQSASFLARGKE